MATLVKESLQDRIATTCVSTSGPAYMVAVGGAPRGSRAKTNRTTGEEPPIMSRYLRPSTGSCHDLCKHGMQDEWLELKRPTPRLGSRKKSVVKNIGIKGTVVLVERNKIPKRNPKPSPNPKIHVTTEPVQVIKLKTSPPSKNIGNSKHSSLTNREANQNELRMPKSRPTNVKTKPTKVNNSSATINASAGLNGQKRKKDIKIIKKTGMVPKSISDSKAIQTGSLPPKPSGSRAVSLEGSKYKGHKLMSPLKDQNLMTKTKLKQLIVEKVQEMALHEIIPSPTMKSTNLSDSESHPSSFDQEVLEEESSLFGRIETSSTEQVSRSESGDADDEEVIEEECEYTDNEEDIILEDDFESETSEGNHKKIPRRYRVVICEDKDDASKLKFRRGRVIEIQSDDNGPRRLKFRRGRILDDGDGKSMGRIRFKKAKVGEAVDDCNQSETVTLKHQEVQQRKEVQELLNSVIEETASKLVDDMKSKVEALVGAFETVISRQDDTLASSTESC